MAKKVHAERISEERQPKYDRPLRYCTDFFDVEITPYGPLMTHDAPGKKNYSIFPGDSLSWGVRLTLTPTPQDKGLADRYLEIVEERVRADIKKINPKADSFQKSKKQGDGSIMLRAKHHCPRRNERPSEADKEFMKIFDTAHKEAAQELELQSIPAQPALWR